MSDHETGVLLATDLGPRCDRATDRARALAEIFGGRAIAVTVVEPAEVRAQDVPKHAAPSWYRQPTPHALAERELHREFDAAGAPWDVRVLDGKAGDHLAAILDAEGDALVVAGPVRQGMVGPAVLGSTVDRLLRRPATSLLTVRRRAHGGYRHLLVASDFSNPCMDALRRARTLFPDAKVTVLHGFEVPMLGMMDTSKDQALAQTAAQLRQEGRAFLREAGCGDDVELVVEHGDPARLAQQYVETHDADLVVLGTHGRGAVFELIVGSVARRILTTVDADTLVVRG